MYKPGTTVRVVGFGTKLVSMSKKLQANEESVRLREAQLAMALNADIYNAETVTAEVLLPICPRCWGPIGSCCSRAEGSGMSMELFRSLSHE